MLQRNGNEFDSYIAELERMILALGDGKLDSEYHGIRKKICEAIKGVCLIENDRCKSLGDHITEASSSQHGGRQSSLLLLRMLGEAHVIPPHNPENQLERKIVTLIEKCAPDLYQSFKVTDKKQTYEKYSILQAIHGEICQRLSILKNIPSDIEKIGLIKQEIQRALANKDANAYLQIYNFREVRTKIELILGFLSDLAKITDASFVAKVQETKDYFNEEITWCKQKESFLTVGFYLPFLQSASQAVANLDETSKERFECELAARRKQPNLAEKRYPLHEIDREITIIIPLVNRGPGIALDVVAEINSNDFLLFEPDARLGDIRPGEFALALSCIVIDVCDKAKVSITLTWGRMGSVERRKVDLIAIIQGQDPNINWDSLEYKEPYSLEVAEDMEFIGRTLKIKNLAKLFLKDRMGSGYITGQKRIGKTSLAKATGKFIENTENGNEHIISYLEYGAYSSIEPVATVEALGNEIRIILQSHLKNGDEFNGLSLRGTLAPLNQMLARLESEAPLKKFLIILDEFDEMHPEMYRFGALAETFFSNLRTLSARRNLGFLLVGGEKMPFVIGSQGDQLNKFSREQLNYFSRTEEWKDYVELVTKPVQGSINWSEAALNALFEWTNGHPYYIKLLCTKIFITAVAERDNEITEGDVKHGVNRLVGQLDINAFAHLWKDGIAADRQESEVRELQRCRLLVAVAKALRNHEVLNKESVTKYKNSTNLPEHEIQAVLNEFCRREILKEVSGSYEFVVPLFKLWLEQVGINKLILDSLGEEFEAEIKAAEEKAYVSSSEITDLVDRWPVYRGMKITSDDVRAWLEQVPDYTNQRLLFKILSNSRVVPFLHIREQLKLAHNRMVLPIVEEFIIQKKSDRRNDILITYIDGPAKSGAHYAALYAEENIISSSCVISPNQFEKSLITHEAKFNSIKTLVIVDDIIATGDTIKTNLRRFVTDNLKLIQDRSLSIVVIVLAATQEGEERVRNSMKQLPSIDIDLRVCEPISKASYAFTDGLGFWQSLEEKERAKSLCLDLGSRICKNAPLGYASQGLLYIFTDTCPNNTLPILHTHEKKAGGWKPLFERPKN